MTDPKPAYPIVTASQIQPRDQIKLVPEEQLDPLTRVELSNLRAGVPYKFTIADTPENRERFNFKALYFQLVAYKEGWRFRPENLQVAYVPPEDIVFQKGKQQRIMQLARECANKEVLLLDEEKEERSLESKLPYAISPEGRLGFIIDKEHVTQIQAGDTDDLAAKVIHLFG